MTERRKELLKRLENFKVVPGHGPDINAKTDDELELYLSLLETMFKRAFSQADDEEGVSVEDDRL
ncbi:hypothetical protein [Paenibacillus thiaminolyticus]|uniref:hypothetical protein n=1 Tax=Paenibacillus thiaminolyticus TaxID=49283 RepID=UPI002543986F|nr:hypothetical protein [Paenibacillus thiaminolyticus]WII36838.1 hypothetical protein O0V01_24915 [Paenibacillus thiaminolyticus]